MTQTTQQWWYAVGGQQRGPVPGTELQQLVAAGEIQRTSMVWTAGMAGWAPAEQVLVVAWPAPAGPPEPPPMPAEPRPAATIAVGAPAPTAAPLPQAAIAPYGGAATPAQAVADPEEVSIATVVLLSIVTLGVYGAVKFYQTGLAYERLAGRETKFKLYFWLFVGFVAAGLTIGVVTTLPIGLVALVFQFLALSEALRARREGLQRWGLQVQVTKDNTHYLFLAFGTVLVFLVIGVVFLILEVVKWFEDWNAIRAAALARATSPAPRPS